MTTALTIFYNAALVFLLAWPATHYWLVHNYQVNPWKLGGLAMYTSPYVTRIEIWDDTSVPKQVLPEQCPDYIQRHVTRFSFARSALGKLTTPAELASELFRYDDKIERLRFRIIVRKFEPKTLELVELYTAHRYSRTVKHASTDQAFQF